MNQLTKQFQRKLHISSIASSDHSSFNSEDDEIQSILLTLIQPNQQGTNDPQVISLYNNWKIPITNTLPITSPINYTPFEYYSTYNSNKSYIDNPRLSVTKLLSLDWCELQRYYQIYAGSLPIEPNKSMKLGTQVHLKLEREIHPEIDLSKVQQFIMLNFKQISGTSEEFKLLKQIMYGDKEVNEMGITWADEILRRLFTLITTGEAREVLIHGYIDLEKQLFVNNIEELPNVNESKKVLISGIVDHFIIQTDSSMFEDINEFLLFEMSEFNNENIQVDLSKFFKNIPEIINKHSNNKKLILSDVKTRSTNNTPVQQSVLDSAKLQTFYYKHMFELLTNSIEFTYLSLLRNSQLKGIDIDKPLSIIAIFTILRTNYQLFFNDFMKLSQGQPIGFPPFDNTVQHNSYEFGKFFQSYQDFSWDTPNHENLLNKLNQLDPEVDYQEILLPLLTTWKIPPTMRYFAARASQFYSLFQYFPIPETQVEYTNNSSGEVFNLVSYEYNYNQLKQSMIQGCGFWDGTRDPIPTQDLSRCKYCQFKDKCVVPNGGVVKKQKSNMDIVKEFLKDVNQTHVNTTM